MSAQRKIVALAVAFCFFMVESIRAATPVFPASVKEQAAQLGPGAKVKLKLADGTKLQGSIEAVQDDSLLLASGKNAPKRITYDQVARLTPADRRYHASGQPDPQEVRRVVLALGVGKHVVVNQPGTKAIHGFVQAIDADHFTVLPDHETAPVQIAYANVRHVEKNLSLGATIVLVVLIAAGLIVGLTVAATR